MKRNYSVNLEISSRAVKLLEAVRRKKDLVITSCHRREYDQSKTQLEAAVRSLHEQVKSPQDFVTTSIWAPTMFLRKIAMPLMGPQEIAGAVEIEADKHIPFAVNDCILDHYVLGRNETAKKIDVMLIAAKKDLIVERCKSLEQAGVQVSIMDIHPMAVCNLYFRCYPDDQNETLALIHLGAAPGKYAGEENFMCVVKDGRPHVARDLGDRFLQETEGGENWRQLAGSIMNGIVFFENSSGAKVNEILLSGEAATTGKIMGALKNSTSIKIRTWSPLEKLEFESHVAREQFEADAPSFLVCAGLAARRLFG